MVREARHCVRYVYDAHGNVLFDPLPEGAQIVPARALLTKRSQRAWLAVAAVAAFPLFLEACGGVAPLDRDDGGTEGADATDAGADGRVTANPEAASPDAEGSDAEAD